MATKSLVTQTSTERRSAEARLKELLAALAPDHLRLVAAMRRLLRKRLPAAHEVVYEYRDCVVVSFSPSENGYEGVLAIRAGAAGIKLYFNRGKDLSDPEKLLKGASGLVRSMDVEAASALARNGLARLIDEAIEQSPKPFARTGKGTVVVRETSASRRRATSAGGRRSK